YEEIPERYKEGYVAFVIGANHVTKQLTNEKIIEVCKRSVYPVVLIGGDEDSERGKAISSRVGEHVMSACGITTLKQSAAIISFAKKIITHDTGMMHIAAALKKDMITIWGNTVPEFGMWPLYPSGMNKSVNFQVNGLSCRPCTKLGYSKCPKGHFKCIEDQNIDKIVKQLNKAYY
ncbi:MAG: glycosyltransferase family 9 protein, partial [Flavobacteriales bacterium]